jgi:hypothetical protein
MGRKRLLERVIGLREIPRQMESDPLPEVSENFLRWLLSPSPKVIAWARALHERVRESGDEHTRLMGVIGTLAHIGDHERCFLQTLFAYSRLCDAADAQSGQNAAVRDVLNRLPTDVARGLGRNPDATLMRVYQVLLDFHVDRPDLLELSDIWDVFHRVQQQLSPNPHYRVEMICAKVRYEQFPQARDPQLLWDCLKHLNRALTLHSRCNEALHFRSCLFEEFPALREELPGEAKSVSTTSAMDGELPRQDVVKAINRISGFYDRLLGPGAMAEARQWFENNSGHPSAVVRNRLVLMHASFLQRNGSGLEAERLILEFLRQQHGTEDWEPHLELLDEIWTAAGISYERSRKTIDDLETRVPSQSRHCLLLLEARMAFRAGQLEEARQKAQQAYAAQPTADALKLARRCDVRLGMTEKLSFEEWAADNAWNCYGSHAIGTEKACRRGSLIIAMQRGS